MQYEKRLRFINYIKENFIVKKNEIIAFHFFDFDEPYLFTAEKIDLQKNSSQLSEYFKERTWLELGDCLLADVCERGPYLEFTDNYLRYSEYVSLKRCVNNSLNESPEGFKIEVTSEIEQLIRELNGEKPIYYKSNC